MYLSKLSGKFSKWPFFKMAAIAILKNIKYDNS